ncbi:hypothetical protein ACLI4U_15070 [Natrialbaceae archaeon A-CW2]
MTAIVCNCAYNGLSIIQELGRNNIDVHAVDSFPNIGTTSKYATYHKCPNPTTDEPEFVDYLIDLAAEFDDNPVIIPANDHWASAIANNLDRLSAHSTPCVADAPTVDLLLNKRAFGEWANDRSYPVPRTWRQDEVTDIPDNSFPIAAKPGDARHVPDMMFRSRLITFWNRLTGTSSNPSSTSDEKMRRKSELYTDFRLKIFNNLGELQSFIDTYPDLTSKFTFQEYVRGMSDSMYTVGVYANDGIVKGVFTGRKVRGYPPDIGDCKVGQVESVPDRLVEVAKSICDELNYTGIAEFEYKKDTKTGDFYLIEINPRSWSWIGITPACGVNLPLMAYLDLSKSGDVSYLENKVPDGSVKWIKATEDFLNVLIFYRQTHDEWANGVLGWKSDIDGRKTVFAEGKLNDPLPICYSGILIIRRLMNMVKKSLHSKN